MRAVYAEATDVNIIAELAEKNQTEDRLSGDEEHKKVQEKLLSSKSKAMMHIHIVCCDSKISFKETIKNICLFFFPP